MHFKKIVGKKVYLSPRSVDDAEKYTLWLNNYDIAKYINHNVSIITIESEKEYLAKDISDGFNFAIVDLETDELIGSIGLMHVNCIDGTAELGIFIGDENHLSRGYGSEAIILLLDFGFNQVNLNNIMLKVFSFNKRALRAYEKCGFKTFGVWEKSHYIDGEYHDIIYMNIFKEDFNNDNKKKLCK